MQIDHVTDAVISRLVAALASANTAAPVLLPATIAAGESMSEAVPVPKAMRLWALALPEGWNESAVSYSISFNARDWFEPVDYSSGAALTETAPGRAGTAFLVSSYALLRAPFVKIRAGSAAAPIVQQTSQTLQLLFVPYNSPTIF
jgi:hypothetical protein